MERLQFVLPDIQDNPGNENKWIVHTGKAEKVYGAARLTAQIAGDKEKLSISPELQTLFNYLSKVYQEPASPSAVFAAEHKAIFLHDLIKNILGQNVKTIGADTGFKIWQVSKDGQQAHWETWHKLARTAQEKQRLLNDQEINELYLELLNALVYPNTPDQKIHLCWEIAASLQNGQSATISEKLLITAKPIPLEIFNFYFEQLTQPVSSQGQSADKKEDLNNLPLLYKINTRLPLIEIITQFNLIEKIDVVAKQQTYQRGNLHSRKTLITRKELNLSPETEQATIDDVIKSVPQAILGLIN